VRVTGKANFAGVTVTLVQKGHGARWLCYSLAGMAGPLLVLSLPLLLPLLTGDVCVDCCCCCRCERPTSCYWDCGSHWVPSIL